MAEHGDAVWRTVYRLLDHHADAQDCYQETFLAAWRFAQREPVAEWRPFLVSLATRPLPSLASSAPWRDALFQNGHHAKAQSSQRKACRIGR